jgi:hypothetical protein
MRETSLVLGAESDSWTIIIACAVLMGALIVFYIVATVYYRRFRESSSSSDDQTPWTLDDLRKLRDQGDLTPEEYQKLRAAIIGAFQRESGTSNTGAETPDKRETPENKSDFDLKTGPQG